ncbi:hypothetical protein E2C01_032234 [Portunus trituberculatus]|uniref:Uncharacterized protein n=1 Tax=Portunus trituberculatus TaxID=210409 RepID=A0A5B7EWZ6_PORTR|nr:hypothetical protein [Portunus trituberculatus]
MHCTSTWDLHYTPPILYPDPCPSPPSETTSGLSASSSYPIPILHRRRFFRSAEAKSTFLSGFTFQTL